MSPDAFAELLKPHLAALYRLAFRFTGRQFDAEDLLQELLTRLYAHSQQRLTEVESLRPWLARALYNLHVDQRRGMARTPFGHLKPPTDGAPDGEGLDVRSDVSADADFSMEMELLRANLVDAVAELPEEQRLVVILHDVEGYQLDEAAGILGVALGTVKSRLNRAHGRLRERLGQRNLIPSNIVLRNESPGCDSAILSLGAIEDEV
jgi:RNA polymerase sigma factor (sigma-70 family)